MSYSIAISGHGAKAADVSKVFDDAIAALEKSGDGEASVSGYATGADAEGNTVSRSIGYNSVADTGVTEAAKPESPEA